MMHEIWLQLWELMERHGSSARCRCDPLVLLAFATIVSKGGQPDEHETPNAPNHGTRVTGDMEFVRARRTPTKGRRVYRCSTCGQEFDRRTRAEQHLLASGCVGFPFQ